MWGGIKDGMIKLAPFNKVVPQDVQDLVKKAEAEIAAGKLHPFTGPDEGQHGQGAAGRGQDDHRRRPVEDGLLRRRRGRQAADVRSSASRSRASRPRSRSARRRATAARRCRATSIARTARRRRVRAHGRRASRAGEERSPKRPRAPIAATSPRAERQAAAQDQGRAAQTRNGIDLEEELADDWRNGGYPYKYLLSRKSYERQKYRLQVELLKLQRWVKETRPEGRRPVRRPRRRRQGRHHQALHGAPESARRARGRARQADRGRARAVVFPALRAPPAHGRRDRAVRPLLVQPRGRRARDGLLHATRNTRSSCARPRCSSRTSCTAASTS